MKKIFILFSILCLAITLTSCKQLEDTNGDSDYTIQSISDAEIINPKGNSLEVMAVENNTNKGGTLKIGKFSGVKQVRSFKLDQEEKQFSITVNVEKGNLRVVLICDEKIVQDIEVNHTTIVKMEGQNKEYLLKVVGESAKFSLEYKFV